MIKRYSIGTPLATLRKRYNATIPKRHRPNYNAGVKKALPIITRNSRQEFQLFNWGIVPSSTNDSKIADKLLNARLETLKAKQPFCDLLDNRCLIPADAFYIWKENDENNRPYRVVLPHNETFSILGLFHEWGEEENEDTPIVKTFASITCESSDAIKKHQHRMPLIIPKHLENDWLIGKKTDNILDEALEFTKSIKFEIYEVSGLINDEKNNNSKFIQNETHTLPGQTLSIF
jgi:putative SOS response-associated peptidase YedK